MGKKLLIGLAILIALVAGGYYWATTQINDAVNQLYIVKDTSPQKGALEGKYTQIKSRLKEMTRTEIESVLGKPDGKGAYHDPEAVGWILSNKSSMGISSCHWLWIRFANDGHVVSVKEETIS